MSRKRQAAEARGRWAECVAMLVLVLKGYRLLDHRARTPAGEIDLVAQRGEYLVFIEVKARPDLDEAQAALGPRQRERIIRAASVWMARHRRFSGMFPRYDLFLVAPWRWPVHHRAAWVPDDRAINLL